MDSNDFAEVKVMVFIPEVKTKNCLLQLKVVTEEVD